MINIQLEFIHEHVVHI